MNSVKLSLSFYTFGIYAIKASQKMLMKLTTGVKYVIDQPSHSGTGANSIQEI